jgi:hypothetical protein
MAKNNRVRVTQNKTFSFKIEHIQYIEKEAKRIGQSSAQLLGDAIQLHKDVMSGVFGLEMMTDETKHSDVIPESQLSN